MLGWPLPRLAPMRAGRPWWAAGGCAPKWCPSCWSYSAGSPAGDVTSSDGRILGTDTNIRLMAFGATLVPIAETRIRG